jgi:galactokinase/mevalonate kinase-like predicted kinase
MEKPMSAYEEKLYSFTKIHFDDLPKETRELITRVGASNPQLLSLARIFADEAGYLFQHAPFLIEEVVAQKDSLFHLHTSIENEVQLGAKLENARQKLERRLESQREKYKNDHFIMAPGDLVSIYAPARIPFNSCIASDKVVVNLTEDSLVLNMSVRLHGERPVVIRLRVIDDYLIRVNKTDVDSSGKRDTVTGEFKSKERILDLSDVSDPFRLVKTVLIVSGIVNVQDTRPLSEVLLALGGGFELEIHHHLAQGGGSSNIMSMSLLLAINYSVGRESSVEELSNNVLLAEYLTGSLGGWNDHLGGYYPGVKEFTAKPGAIFPTIREIPLSNESRIALEERLILWDSGDLRPSLSSTFKQALGTQAATQGRLKILRQQTRRIHHRMVEALQRGDMSGLGRLLTQKNILGNLASPNIARTHFDNVTSEVSDLIDGASYIGAAGGGYYIFMARQGAEDRLVSQLNKSGVVTPWSLDTHGTEIVRDHAGLASLRSKTLIDDWMKVFDRLRRDAEEHPDFHETITFTFEGARSRLLDFSVSIPKHLNKDLLEIILAYTSTEINNRIMTHGAARVVVRSSLPDFVQKLDSYFEKHYNSPDAITGVSMLVGKALGVGRFAIAEASNQTNDWFEQPKQENIQRDQPVKIRAVKIVGVNFGRMMTKVGVMAIDDMGQFCHLAMPRRFETHPKNEIHNVQTLSDRAITAMKDILKEAGVSISELNGIGVSIGLKLTGEIIIRADGKILKNAGFTEGSLNENGDSTFDLIWRVSQAFLGKATFAVNDGDMEALGIARQYGYRNTLVLKFGNELAAGYINEEGEVVAGVNEFGNVVLDFAENAPRQEGTEVRGYAGGLIPWLGIEHNARELKLYDKYGFDETVAAPNVLSRWLIDGTEQQKDDARKVFTRVGHYIAMLGKALAKYYTIEHIVLTGGILMGETGSTISIAANRSLVSQDMVRPLDDNPLTLKFGALVGLTYKAALYC